MSFLNEWFLFNFANFNFKHLKKMFDMLTFCLLYQYDYMRSLQFCEKIHSGLYYIFS